MIMTNYSRNIHTLPTVSANILIPYPNHNNAFTTNLSTYRSIYRVQNTILQSAFLQ